MLNSRKKRSYFFIVFSVVILFAFVFLCRYRYRKTIHVNLNQVNATEKPEPKLESEKTEKVISNSGSSTSLMRVFSDDELKVEDGSRESIPSVLKSVPSESKIPKRLNRKSVVNRSRPQPIKVSFDQGESDAINVIEPVDELVKVAFSAPHGSHLSGSRFVTSIEWGFSEFRPEVEYRETVGAIRRNEYQEYRAILSDSKKELKSLVLTAGIPEKSFQISRNDKNMLVRRSRVSVKESEHPKVKSAKLSDVDRRKSPDLNQTKNKEILIASRLETETDLPPHEQSNVLSDSVPQYKVVKEPDTGKENNISERWVNNKKLTQRLFNPKKTPVTTQLDRISKTPFPDMNYPSKKGEGFDKVEVVSNGDKSSGGQILFGKLVLDPKLEDWIEYERASIELYLHPVRSSDPQDTVYLTHYKFPSKDFEIDTRRLNGEFRLRAAFYKASSSFPVSRVMHPELISSHFNGGVRFQITKDMVMNSIEKERSGEDPINLYLTLFEVSPESHQKNLPISQASVSIVGFPERGVFSSDENGNIFISNVPKQSELMLHLSKKGYFSSFKAVLTTKSHGYETIYLISKEMMKSVTSYIKSTSNSLNDVEHLLDGGFILGRIFDPGRRIPKKFARVFLSGRKKGAIYFDYDWGVPRLDLSETTDNGLFLFLHIKKPYKSILREGEVPMMVNVLEGTGQFFDIGRSGSGEFIGKIRDPFSEVFVTADVRALGEKHIITSNLSGEFKIPNVDLPAGPLTFELSSKGYPLTWVTSRWNPRDISKSDMFMLSHEMVENVLKISGKSQSKEMGILIGGKKTFGRKKSCYQVKLFQLDNTEVSHEFGPNSLYSRGGSIKCLNQKQPGFSFVNLEPGEYILNWYVNRSAIRSHIVRVGAQRRVSIVVD